MATNRTKLELTWIGKENRPRLEPRILLEDPEKSYHAGRRVSESDLFDNRLIFGDNLLALKALEQEFTGKVKCIYVDPPFNTQQAFEHYDDGVEHSVWLTMMRERIELLHRLLCREGTFCVHIDDNELGYLIVLCDEIFGRTNRCYIVTFKQSSVSGPKAINPGLVTTSSYILIYAKDKGLWRPKKGYKPISRDKRYGKYIQNFDDGHEHWRLVTLREALAASETSVVNDLRRKYSTAEELEARLEEFVLKNPNRVVRTARVAPKDINADCREALKRSAIDKTRVFHAARDGRDDMYFFGGEQLIFYSAKTRLVDGRWITGEAVSTMWDDLLSNNLHNEGQVAFPNGKKPEGLLKRILDMFSDPQEWVLDSFAGSGTTGAVAHKLGRRWIMVELGEHCQTHVLPRLKRVIDGEDTSGVTEATNWKGGGGFRYYRLAPSLLRKDRFGNWVVNRDYNAEMLAEAVCKLEGFTYAPSDTVYWQHGHSTETDFVYVTTQSLTREQLAQISDEVGDSRSLLICCGAFRSKGEAFPNLTVKKIPKAVLRKCEYGHDDYSLEIRELPPPPPAEEPPARTKEERRKRRQEPEGQGELF